MTARRVGTAGVIGSLIAVVLLASSSWACTAVARVEFEGVNSGLPGSQATVRGFAFEAAPVELRWKSADGPVVARATGPSFSVPVTIPGVTPGPSYLIGVQRDSKGKVWRVPASFHVLAPGEQPPVAPVLTPASPTLLEQPSNGGGGSSSMALGVGLLSVGGAILLAGSTVVAVRRRRAVAVAPSSIHDR